MEIITLEELWIKEGDISEKIYTKIISVFVYHIISFVCSTDTGSRKWCFKIRLSG